MAGTLHSQQLCVPFRTFRRLSSSRCECSTIFVVVRRSRLPFFVCLASGESGEKQRPSVKRPKNKSVGNLPAFQRKSKLSSCRSRFELK